MNTSRITTLTLVLVVAALIVGLTACDQLISILSTGDMPDGEVPDDMGMMTGLPMDIAMYRSWTGVELEAPPATFTEPQDSGVAHGAGTRTVYINAPGVSTLQDMSAETFPSGTTIVKDIMDDANTFIWRVAVMWKMDDMAYADHNGWKYVQYQRESDGADFMAVAGDGTAKGSNGCHGCHSKVNTEDVPGKDSVFVQLPMPDDMGMMSGLPMDIAMYRDWTPVEIGPPSASGVAHGQGDRTVYINQPGVETLKDMSADTFPAGTTLVKDIMDDTNSFLWRVAVMWKMDDMAYEGHNGWKYVQYQRESDGADLMAVAGDGTAKGSNGCHGCHSAVNDPDSPGKDSVFVQLPMPGDGMTDDGMTDDDTADDDTADDGMSDDDMMDDGDGSN